MSNDDIGLNELRDMAHGLANDKGWYDDWPVEAAQESAAIMAKLMLVVSELAEAGEELRSGRMSTWVGEGYKPEGFAIEIADAFIRLSDLCGKLGIDVAKAVREKHRYNTTRPYRHGGKRA